MSGYWLGGDDDLKGIDHGSMIATAQDVGIFLRALCDGTLLTRKEQTLYTTLYRYEHTGLDPGYQSIARYHQDIDTVVIQFTNTCGGDAWTYSDIVYSRILKLLRKGK